MTPGAGEKAIAGQLAIGVTGRAALYESLGMTPAIANEIAEAFDEIMDQCILNLYRSALPPTWAQWRERLSDASARPGLFIIPTEDPYTGGQARHRWAAERTGAQVAVLAGLGHWWLLQQPASAAETLLQFWSSLD